MSYYQVSEENMKKVEAFFVRKVKELGTNRIEVTVVEVAEGSKVALATAHNAIKQLIVKRIVTKIKPTSRRDPITYIYNRSIDDFDNTNSIQDQVAYLQSLVQELQEKVLHLEEENNGLRGENMVLKNKLTNSYMR